MVGNPQQSQQDNQISGILTPQQQTELAAVKTAEDLKHFMEQKAMDALSAAQKAEVQKYWEEHDSPQALEAAKKATEANEREDNAILGFGATLIGTAFLADRGGVSSLGPLMGAGPLGLIASLGVPEQKAPGQNGPTPPQNNNIFSLA